MNNYEMQELEYIRVQLVCLLQTLCREFIKETSNYINCNTKNLDNVVKIIKEQTNEK